MPVSRLTGSLIAKPHAGSLVTKGNLLSGHRPSRFTVNGGLRYDFYSNPTEPHGRLSAIRNPATDSAPTVGNVIAGTPLDLLSPQVGFAWKIFANGKTILRGGGGIFRDQLSVLLFGVNRFLPPFFGIKSFVFPSFLNPQNALLTQPIYILATTYHPKFPYAVQYNLSLEREIAPNELWWKTLAHSSCRIRGSATAVRLCHP